MLLGFVFAFGKLFVRTFRFTHALPNYVFEAVLLVLPFFVIPAVLRLPRIAKYIGLVVLTPFLFISLSLMIASAIWGAPELAGNYSTACMEELAQIKRGTYSVHLVRDGCGGAMVSFVVFVEQRIPVLPGLYRFRMIDAFESAYEGKLTYVGPDQIRVQIPKGVEGSGWNGEIDRVYQLKKRALF